MKIKILISGIIFTFLYTNSIAAYAIKKQSTSNIDYNYAKEISEWIFFAGVLSSISVWYWFGKSLCPGKPLWEERETTKALKNNTIPSCSLFLASPIIATGNKHCGEKSCRICINIRIMI